MREEVEVLNEGVTVIREAPRKVLVVKQSESKKDDGE